MPGAGMIGERHAHPSKKKKGQQGMSSLSAQVRNLSRLLNLLNDSDAAVSAVLAALKQSPVLKRSQNAASVESSLQSLRHKEGNSVEIAQIVQDAFHLATGKEVSNRNKSQRERRKSAYNLFYADCANKWKKEDSEIFKGKGQVAKIISKKWNELSDEEKERFQAKADEINREIDLMDSQAVQTQTATVEKVSAIVSDGEGGSRVETTSQEANAEEEFALIDFWPNLMEAVTLQVSSRTTRTWGRKKIYEVYRLAGPTMPVSNGEKLREKIAREFLALYDGSVGVESNRSGRYNECRVFVTQHTNPRALWVQLNIGRPFDCYDESNRTKADGHKKKKAANEFVAMIEPETNLVVLTASRAPSRTKFTPYILAALETVFTCSVAGGYASGDNAQRVHDLSGTEPFELLRSAKAIESGDAVGRFSHYAAAGSSSNPISELQEAATASLLNRNKQQERLEIGAKHGRTAAHAAAEISRESDGQARLAGISTTGICVDHSAREQESRKRSHEAEFGGEGDCPQRQFIRWDWKGPTAAPRTCWGETAAPAADVFKCRVTLKGPDVFKGMRALMDAGIMKGPLPPHVRDAAILGTNITVDHGMVVRSGSPVNEK